MTDATFRFALVYRLSEIPAVFQFRIRDWWFLHSGWLDTHVRWVSNFTLVLVQHHWFLQLAILHTSDTLRPWESSCFSTSVPASQVPWDGGIERTPMQTDKDREPLKTVQHNSIRTIIPFHKSSEIASQLLVLHRQHSAHYLSYLFSLQILISASLLNQIDTDRHPNRSKHRDFWNLSVRLSDSRPLPSL